MPRLTSFQTTEYPVVGASDPSRVTDLSTSSTKGMHVVSLGDGIKNKALISFPGLKAWSSGTVDFFDRGFHKRVFNSKGWKVSGGTLYSFDSNGAQSSEGSITGSGLCSFADNGSVLLICNGSAMYSHNGTTLSTLSLSFTPLQVDFLNGKFFALATDGGVYVSNVGTTDFDASYTPNSSIGTPVGIQVFNQFIFNFTDFYIEPWEDVDSGSPPVARMNGAIIEDTGLLNRNCLAITGEAIYFVGQDKMPYQLLNFQANNLAHNDMSIGERFESYDMTDSYVQADRVDAKDVIRFVLPREKKTWCYGQQTGEWFELDHDVNNQLYLGKTSAFIFNKNLVGDRKDGHIYEMDAETYQNAGTSMVRERIFKPFAGEALGRPREPLRMRMMRFGVETGIGGDKMMVSYSTDGGRSFSNERWLDLGGIGDYLEEIEDYSNRRFKDIAVKVRYVGNTSFSLYSSSLDWRPA